MTTATMERMLQAKTPEWVKEHFDALKGSNYVLGGVPQMGEEITLLKPQDSIGKCFEAVNIGRVCEEPIMSTDRGIGGIAYKIVTDTFPFEAGSTDKRRTITIALAEGIVPNSHR